jgi:multidrug transporter EmrE-like cation transporter
MWFRLMMIAFVFNGLSSFGLRILTGMGLAKEHTLHYLVFWYVGGAVAILLAALSGRARISMGDLFVGSGLGVLSGMGQSFIGMALSTGLPGNVVFPVALAGGLFIVVAIGVTVFRERVGWAGVTGILLGIVSIALLSVE